MPTLLRAGSYITLPQYYVCVGFLHSFILTGYYFFASCVIYETLDVLTQ